MNEPKIWTVAFRKQTGPWFRRVNLELTWAQAYWVASEIGQIDPSLQVFYTTTKACDDASVEEWKRDGYREGLLKDRAEDAHTILTDSGKRVAVKELANLPWPIEILDEEEAQRRWQKGVDERAARRA